MSEGKSKDTKLVLAVDSTTGKSSVTLARGGDIIKSLVDEKRISQSSGLLMLINELLDSVNSDINGIDFFSIATGPGSFTGARVGITTMKGLSYSLNKVCVGVPTLKALAHAAGVSSFTLSVLPAGRGEVFAGKFKVSPKGEVISLSPAVCTSIKEILEEVENEPYLKWVGDGVLLLKSEIISFAEGRGQIVFEESASRYPEQIIKGWNILNPGYTVSESVAKLSEEAIIKNPYGNDLRVEYIRPTLI